MDAVEAARVLQRLQLAGVQLWQEEGRLRYRASKGALTSELRTEIAGCREHLLDLLGSAGLPRSNAPARRRDADRPVPLTPAQAAIWVAERSGIAGDAFHISAALDLDGPLDRAALRRSFDWLATRHEALRSCVALVDDRPQQEVMHDLAAPWTERDLSGAEANETTLQAWLQELSEPSFPLDRAPLWRVGLARLGPERHVLAVVLHHLIADGGRTLNLNCFSMASDPLEAKGIKRLPRLPTARTRWTDTRWPGCGRACGSGQVPPGATSSPTPSPSS